jgi:hypothetical protein
VSTPRSTAPHPSSFLRSLTSWTPSLMRWPRDARGLRGEGRGGRSRRFFLGEGGGAWLGLGNSVAFDGMQIESVVFSYSYRGVK